jgi:LysM repeat protein
MADYNFLRPAKHQLPSIIRNKRKLNAYSAFNLIYRDNSWFKIRRWRIIIYREWKFRVFPHGTSLLVLEKIQREHGLTMKQLCKVEEIVSTRTLPVPDKRVVSEDDDAIVVKQKIKKLEKRWDAKKKKLLLIVLGLMASGVSVYYINMYVRKFHYYYKALTEIQDVVQEFKNLKTSSLSNLYRWAYRYLWTRRDNP